MTLASERMNEKTLVDEGSATAVLRSVVAALPDLVAIASDDGRVHYINPAGRHLLNGPSDGEPDEFDVTELFAADGLALWLEEALPTARRDGQWNGELTLCCQAGRELPCSVRLLCETDAEGANRRLIIIARDISVEKKLTRQIRASLARRREEVRLAAQLAQEITADTELTSIYERIVSWIQERFGYYHTQLLRYERSQHALVLVKGYGEVGDRMQTAGHTMPMGTGLIGRAAASRTSQLRPDVGGDPDWRPQPLLPETRGELAVPIVLGEQVLGVLDVQSARANDLTLDDQLLLEGLSGQLATAIESTSLRQEMAGQLRRLERLQRVMSREGWEGYWTQHERDSVAFLYDEEMVHAIVDTKGMGRDSVGHRTPITIRGEVIGALTVPDAAERPLTAEEVALLEAVSGQVAEALEAARLFEQTQAALDEQERLTAELETVAEVGINASTLLQEESLLQSVVDLAKERFNFYHVHIYTVDGDKLILRAGAGRVGRLMAAEGRSIPMVLNSLVTRAARTGEGIIENDTDASSDFLPHPLLPETRAELAVPMMVGEKLMGVLDVQADRPGAFTAKDLLIQQTLAAQVAVALQNAYLYAEQLETAARLREVDRLKSEFLASMSHELRTPLNSIIGFADVLLEGLDGELTPRMTEDVTFIRESGRHLRELIGNILDMSKIEAGMMSLRFEPVNLTRLTEEAMATAKILAQEKGLQVAMDVDDELEPIFADRTRLMQVLLNLLGNAVKFTEEGEVKLSVRRQRDKVEVRISDTGIGMNPEDVPIVFEQFRQVDGSLTRRSGGTGLGMPISKKLVELHGGSIGLETAFGVGTTFWFTIPYRTEPPAEH